MTPPPATVPAAVAHWTRSLHRARDLATLSPALVVVGMTAGLVQAVALRLEYRARLLTLGYVRDPARHPW